MTIGVNGAKQRCKCGKKWIKRGFQPRLLVVGGAIPYTETVEYQDNMVY